MNMQRRNRSSGQELVEFALILPILALLVFGIFDLGRVVYYYSAMQNAAREGTRYGIVALDSGEVTNRVNNRLIGVNPDSVNVVIDDDNVSVTITYNFQPITPFIGSFFSGGEISITSSSIMERED